MASFERDVEIRDMGSPYRFSQYMLQIAQGTPRRKLKFPSEAFTPIFSLLSKLISADRLSAISSPLGDIDGFSPQSLFHFHRRSP
ncbi:hypothetical protein GCM10009567_16170 [Rothia amarae]